MHLGEFLRRMAGGVDEAEALEALGDLALYARVEATSAAFGESTGEYVSNAAGRFAATAADDAWMSLITAVEKSESPQRAALGEIIGWALERDRHDASDAAPCACGSKTGSCTSV